MEEFLKTLPIYVAGQELAEDEYLLKVYQNKGFLCKFTKKGIPPKPFSDWGNYSYSQPNPEPPLTTYIYKNEYLTGWKFNHFRIGESQNWVGIKHPKGFTLEIYLDNFTRIIERYYIKCGVIAGRFKWVSHELIEM